MGKPAGAAFRVLAAYQRDKLYRCLGCVNDFEAEAIDRLRSKKPSPNPKDRKKKPTESEFEKDPDRLVAIPRVSWHMRVDGVRIVIHPTVHRAIREGSAALARHKLHIQDLEIRGFSRWRSWIEKISMVLLAWYLLEYGFRVIGVISLGSDGFEHVWQQFLSIYDYELALSDTQYKKVLGDVEGVIGRVEVEAKLLVLHYESSTVPHSEPSMIPPPWTSISTSPTSEPPMIPSPRTSTSTSPLVGLSSRLLGLPATSCPAVGSFRDYIRSDELRLARFMSFSGLA